MKLLVLVVSALLTLAIGIRVYDAFSVPHRLTCVTTEFNFGCFTPWGWALSLGAAVAVAAGIYAGERFRGE